MPPGSAPSIIGLGFSVFGGALVNTFPVFGYPMMGIGVLLMAWGVRIWHNERKKVNLTINVGDTEPHKVVNTSNSERHEFVRAVISNSSSNRFSRCHLEANRVSPTTDEASLYIINERFSVPGNGDVPIDIAHLDVIEGQISPIMLRQISPSGTLNAIPLQRDNYVMRLSVSGNGSLLCEKNIRLWVESRCGAVAVG